jgi:alkylhydroperoxidase family enzyme
MRPHAPVIHGEKRCHNALLEADGRAILMDPPPFSPDMFLAHLRDSTPQADGQSDLRHLFAYDPDRTNHLLEFTQAVMRREGPLSAGERELIAAMTSRDNQCLF